MVRLTKQTKVNNLEAYIPVLRAKIKAEEKRLNDAVKARMSEEDFVRDLLIKRAEQKEEIQEGLRFVAAEVDKLNSLRVLTEKKQEKLKEREKLTDGEIRDKQDHQKKEEGKWLDQIISLKKSLDNLVGEFQVREKSQLDRIQFLNFEIETLEKKLDGVTERMNHALDTLSEATESLVSVLNQKDDALVEYEKLVQNSETLKKNLEDKKEQLDKKEKDLEVWEHRLKKWARENYKSTNIKI